MQTKQTIDSWPRVRSHNERKALEILAGGGRLRSDAVAKQSGGQFKDISIWSSGNSACNILDRLAESGFVRGSDDGLSPYTGTPFTAYEITPEGLSSLQSDYWTKRIDDERQKLGASVRGTLSLVFWSAVIFSAVNKWGLPNVRDVAVILFVWVQLSRWTSSKAD